MASLDFTDATGATSLASAWPAPANRFRNWTPAARPIGEGAHALGDGRRYLFQHRVDYTATLEIAGIPNTGLAVALRLMEHLWGGGFVQITTGDAASRVYATCGLAPDTEPELVFEDPQMLEYTFRATLLNLAATPIHLRCEYP